MARTNPYNWTAVKTWVAGHHKVNKDIPDSVLYASQMEARCAVLLIEQGVAFTPHVKFVCWTRDNPPQRFTYELDFLLKKPIKPVGTSVPITGIETKGRLRHHDFLRCDSLRFFHSVRTLIVGDDLLTMWIDEGMWPRKEPQK